MAKFKKEVKHEALNLYAEGVKIVEIDERIGCSTQTIDYWRAAKDPMDWDVYRAAADNERIKAALAEIRKKASETVRKQLERSIDLGNVSEAALIDIARRIKSGDLVIDKETTGMLKDIERIFFGVQSQQNSIFDFPTHRIKIDEATKSPLSVDSGDLRKMSKSEIMALLFDLNADDCEE